ncbi:nucleoside hydrolase [Cohnella sp. GCM10012308]|uniref:nucleoside hydrolase n=1 Tax=Cohnella sp. GCM10012308 TaxID=3317329 RepID=UPI003611957F
MKYEQLSQELRLSRLQHPKRRVRIVMDTDTFNEIDDQFAIVYALLSPEAVDVEAFYAAPFYNELSEGPADGMEKSYQELLKISKLMGTEGRIPVYRGSTTYLPDASTPVVSEASEDLVQRALASPDDDPLYVVAIGAITNVASAILMEPSIASKIVVVWLGGHALHWPDTKEFNLFQDLHASRVLMDSGVPLVLLPVAGVSSHLVTTLSELRDYVLPCGEIGEYLYETFLNCSTDHFGYSRVIWDIAAIAWLVNENWLPSALAPSPHISEDFRWSADPYRHFVKVAQFADRNAVFRDLFRKLASNTFTKDVE